MYLREQIPERLSEASLERRRQHQRRRGELFIKGPIPVPWLHAAAKLRGKALAVGLAIWFESGLRSERTVKVGHALLAQFGVNYQASRRALAVLESAGLVTVERHRGRNPIVTIRRKGKGK